jgi:ATP-binding cassette, subfamily B, bacterial
MKNVAPLRNEDTGQYTHANRDDRSDALSYWRFTLITLLVAQLLFLGVYSLTRRIKHTARELRKKESDIFSVVEESLSSIRVVEAFTREDYEVERLDRENRENLEMALQARSVKGWRRWSM